jgi:dienelactone hydrolase
MDTLQFLLHRVAFMGLPFGEIQEIIKRAEAGESWKQSCCYVAEIFRHLAEDAAVSGRCVSAAQAWRWTACAYHAATFGLHLDPDRHGHLDEILELRSMARSAYLKAVRVDPLLVSLVEIPFRTTTIYGYLRTPLSGPAPIVVLLNGLDSLCEVEMHVFGTWLLSRGLAVLSLDLPASFAAQPRIPRLEVEEVAPVVTDWISQYTQFVDNRIGAFGVSFGGHLVARMLAGDPRFSAGVAVSPAAWMSPRELQLKRVRLMFACAFDLHTDPDIDAMACRIHIEQLPPPSGQLLIFQMEQDQLFGPEHVKAFCEWGRNTVEVRTLCAEHVGTSQFHRWLPEACDWLSQRLSCRKGGQPC